MKIRTITLSVLGALTLLAGSQARADSMASLAISPATGAVTLQTRWAIGSGLAGFHHMSQDLSLGGGANQFYSIRATTIPSGGDTNAFYRYIAASGAATNHADIGSKLTPDTYSALTSADPDIGYGPVNFYFIHHKSTGDYFSVIVPGSGTSSAVTDLKPMDGPGGPATLGASGYFGLTFAASNLGYGLNKFYYFRTDAVTGYTKFGTLDPALAGASADQFDLGISGYKALVFTGTDVGYGTDKMYYLRLDPVTGYSVLGTLDPGTGWTSDIANLGGIYTTLAYVPGDLNFGSSRFYTTGVYNPTWQSVSFAAIADRALSAGSFTVAPSASSNLPITLTVLSGSASISGPEGGVFTVTPTASGLIILQATQAGQASPTAYESNMLRQSFMVTGEVPAGFDAEGYLGRYPDLLAAYNGLTGEARKVAAWNHYINNGVNEERVFDDRFLVDEYLALYPDLRAAYGTDRALAALHWLRNGIAEGRFGRVPAGFDAEGYLGRYPDLLAAYNGLTGAVRKVAAWNHYINTGVNEDRVYDDRFLVDEYLALNPDVQAAYGTDRALAALHWLLYGRAAGLLGRVPTGFDVESYLVRYPDLYAAFGGLSGVARKMAAWNHYIINGVNEDRVFDDQFLVDEYLALNPDLQAAYGTDRALAALHWLRYGIAEERLGRVPAGFDVESYLARYPDLWAAFGGLSGVARRVAAWNHYIINGVNEDRVFDDQFLVDEYLALYPDLQAAYGTDRALAALHWLLYGRAEGRLGRFP